MYKTHSVLDAVASSWVQRAAFACTSVQGVLVGNLDDSLGVHVRIRDRAEEQDGLGSEVAHDQERVRHTSVPVVPLAHS